MCGQKIYLWAKKYICGLKNILVDLKIYLWTKKYIGGLKNIFLD